MNADDLERVNGITSRIIGAAQRVSTTLGCGFLEKVYENALAAELRSHDVRVDQQHGVVVRYRGEAVGEYFADLRVESEVIVELKVVKHLDSIHEAQCLNYLKASGAPLCLLMNFAQPRLHVQRIINA